MGRKYCKNCKTPTKGYIYCYTCFKNVKKILGLGSQPEQNPKGRDVT